MPSWPLCLAWCVLGCGGATASSLPNAAVPSHGTASDAPYASAARAPAALPKAFTGQRQPSLLVKNGFPIAQHLFIDWSHQASLAPASSQSFQLAPGTHTITCADSADPDDHPAAITEAFDSGYAYVYELRPGG